MKLNRPSCGSVISIICCLEAIARSGSPGSLAFGFVKTDIPNAYNLSRVRHLNAGDIWRIISDEVADKSTFLQLITLRDVVI
jgi:hypothetical protein